MVQVILDTVCGEGDEGWQYDILSIWDYSVMALTVRALCGYLDKQNENP